jgi:hypothetical protein
LERQTPTNEQFSVSSVSVVFPDINGKSSVGRHNMSGKILYSVCIVSKLHTVCPLPKNGSFRPDIMIMQQFSVEWIYEFCRCKLVKLNTWKEIPKDDLNRLGCFIPRNSVSNRTQSSLLEIRKEENTARRGKNTARL